ncbi:SPARC-related modular calcium-binding protein 1-like isoform X2 [Siphateles boraxobius]|uniref:SPARC-related modular calcium-binding protein 1-like isoform X2 n=1 Tax=Siphateles boraxobius TaxID=180520 RepID=UPI0040635431
MLALTFTCRVLLIFLLSNSVKMTDENQLLVLDKQWPQVCVLDCARGRHQAVCGSNGRMYKSLCSFQRAQCINSQLRMDTLSTCTDVLSSKCQLARSQALRASARSDSLAIFIPICKADGTYAEVQCHTQTGFCWCSSADGMPVSGSSVLHLRPNCTRQMSDIAQETDVELTQANRGVPDPDPRSVPTTAGDTVPPFWVTILFNSDPDGKRPARRPTDSLKNCEHERMSLLAEAGDQGERFIPECSADGRYKSVQCHSGTGYCWCVREDSGRPIPGTSDRNQLPDCSSQETNTLIINNSYTETTLSGCSSVRKTDFLKSLIEAFQQEVESVAPSSPYRTPESRRHVPTSPPPVHTLRLYFMLLDTDGDGVLSEREARPVRLLLRRSLRPRRCAKKFMQSCDRNADRRLSFLELTSCLGI